MLCLSCLLAKLTISFNFAIDNVNVVTLPKPVGWDVPKVFFAAAAGGVARFPHLLHDFRFAHAEFNFVHADPR